MAWAASTFCPPRALTEAERAEARAVAANRAAALEAERAAAELACRVARTGVPEAYRSMPAGDVAREVLRKLPAGTWLFGAQGRGKTAAACQAAVECARRGMDVRFLTAEALLAEADEARRDPSWDRIGRYTSYDLVVLDDADKVLAAGAYGVRELFALADCRHGRPTVYTSNLDYRRMTDALLAAAPEWAGPVMSRIQGCCGPALEVSGPDLRVAGWSS